MAFFDHNKYTFSAFFIDDDHSPSMSNQDMLRNVKMTKPGPSWGIVARTKTENVIILSVYGFVAFDYSLSPFIVITHIVFGSRENSTFVIADSELDIENELRELYKYIVSQLASSTKCTIEHLSDVEIGCESFLDCYNVNNVSPVSLVRTMIRMNSASELESGIKLSIGVDSIGKGDNTIYRLVASQFEPSFVEMWLNYGWDGQFLLKPENSTVDDAKREVLVNIDKLRALDNQKDAYFEVLCYNRLCYQGCKKLYISNTYKVTFVHGDESVKPSKNSAVISISLNDEQLAFVTKHGNRSKFIQKLVIDEMGREETAEHYKPLLNSMIAGIKAKQENQQSESEKASSVNQPINTSSNGVFNLFLSKCLFLSKWHTTTEYTFRDWMAVFEHVTKIEETDRHFLNSDHKYKCLELTVCESADWSPLLCDLAGGINILVSPTHDINDKNGVVYKCVALNSEVRRNAVIYSNNDPVTSTIRLLIIDRLSRDAGFEADLYPLDDAMKQATGNMNRTSPKLLLEQLEKDIVVR